jgi:N-acetylglutamate synthase-like GNAT family acetyltransferase
MSNLPFLVSVRVMTPADAPALAHLLEAIEAQTVTSQAALARLEKSQAVEEIFLAEAAGQAIGLGCLRLAPALTSGDMHAEITELYVDQAYPEQGVEQAMLAHMESRAREKGASQISLLTGFKNAAAQSRYQALSYRPYAMVMRKQLPQLLID